MATIDLLSLLGQREQRVKLLVIATSRQAEIQASDHPLNRVMRSLVARSGALSRVIPKVDVSAVQSFVDRRYPGHVFPESLTELIAKISGGTPLYMVSLLDELVGRGMLAEREGKWTLTVSIEDVQAHRPASVKQLIDMQLDRLTPAEQRVLEAASVVGSEFSMDLVGAALELSAEQVDDTCDALARKLSFVRVEADGRYAFSHALIQEVCAERSSPARRQRWHRLVAQALERDPHAPALSHLASSNAQPQASTHSTRPRRAELARGGGGGGALSCTSEGTVNGALATAQVGVPPAISARVHVQSRSLERTTSAHWLLVDRS